MIPQIHMSMISGEPDLVVVSDAKAEVMERKPLSGRYVLIQCEYGAGLDAGYALTIDVGTRTTTVMDYSTGKIAAMPPAVLKLKQQDAASAMVAIKSTSGILYGGDVKLSASINGADRSIMFGTPEQPFRWRGGANFDDPILRKIQDQTPKYDWNIHTHKWVRLTSAAPPGGLAGGQ